MHNHHGSMSSLVRMVYRVHSTTFLTIWGFLSDDGDEADLAEQWKREIVEEL